ncbi:glutathione S-transferase U9-like [Chenopodium quinoa]|uniref:Glutathione S-transferase n=1 Tax=Chenopodium quinoa TaxID=63459 RepID=A0A803L967_CHEQI|nr:glutathione S-transferase U9-like [Chenopodium quinoa]
MEEESSVKLHGMWASPYVLRVKLALIIKGIDFDYIEEDLQNKSELLLQYNPVHKRVPVLVHNGLSIAESTIILEYIDETWPDLPHLLPKDPYLRAKHRFWAAFIQQATEILGKGLITKVQGKPTEDTMNEYWKKLDTIEEFIKAELFPNGCPSFQEVKPGYLDIVLYSHLGTLDVVEEFLGYKQFTAERYLLLVSWTKALSEVPEVNDATPSKPELIELLHVMQQKNLPLKA